ncbi:crotonobetainyl-CoA:carnitine CoA-transferase CaiB-like acyl-CoA transferase [Desulfitobacterium sp. LBE]|uniref:L-carnitine dehydratase/bile acid-inducible protein F n=2 Tax=root TaxID=1 RepID=B8G0V7_DESHD|nr:MULTISPECIES: CoA transferase [Desulfitobacterium]ACL18376.1 L-carnitine dehydratase/bile acid-inducible protein F [Desulfitobacterium hafniense DCB-2]MEA5023664.1 CoA transferase [Desulfitobacterium hafniense]TWH58696.1 crotonobetainyl-CoA:carnitine CoA-transferase CaiB-like acyl-CoA transferase [Desulfitobacterium sp. LBE]
MLSGIKIIDFTRYFPGPVATLRLAERGAEVIKIEDRAGDPARTMFDTINGEEGCVFRSQSRGKKSVVLDLKQKEDYQKVAELIADADVVIESFRPGVAKRLGIDYETMLRINPSLVYLSLSGFGQNTSISSLGGHDLNYMAYSGVLAQLTDEEGRPIKPKLALADLLGGVVSSEEILAGLVQRERTGKGVYLDVSITESMMALLGIHVSHYSVTGEEHGINDHGIAYSIYETKDGRYMTLGALEEKFWKNFCQGVDRMELLPWQGTAPEAGNPYYQEMVKVFKSKTFKEWAEFSRQVDCCLAPVLAVSELKEQQFVKERNFIEHKWGMDYVATHYRQGKSFLDFAAPYPKLGEHS